MSGLGLFKQGLEQLVAKFDKDRAHYLSKGYPEAQVRVDFLNPLFEALGWDIENKAHKPPHDRDVVVELSPETTKRPDYNFRVNGATKFFVEAKSPSESPGNANHILQAKSYAWSTKEVFFVVLTDFEELRLYDASLKPNPRHPDEGLIFKLTYTDYLDEAERLWELSKGRVLEGSLDALLPRDTKSKRLRIPPDKSFLEDLTVWRTELAKDVHKRNPGFDVKLLNDVVQRLLDRIVFIRIAEDRRIMRDRGLSDIVGIWREEGRRKPIMAHLVDIFHEVNDDLNGDIFKPHACERADVDSALLAEIIESLYFPKSRYRFDAIGVELLGSIYERYLGSTIRVTPQRVKVEEKPEVRKAGGVYYTPRYIVDYIVKNTVGRLIEGKTPKQIEKIRILDPACGSGSFLLGAYQCLIDYHLRWYRERPKEAAKLKAMPLLYYRQMPEEITLPIGEKAKILRNNIFGVDIDPQAVEITMMSLYQKALEGERGLLPRKQHLLPPLSENIKCGNSLIGYDILEQGTLYDDDTKSRINPFDWASRSVGFGEIMEAGGFDVVIGNPPYVRIQAMKEWASVEVEFYKKHYQSASKGNYDIYVVFAEKGLGLLNDKGRLGFILPHKFFQSQYGEPLRGIIAKGKHLSEVVHFGDRQVFDGATTYTCLMFLDRGGSNKVNFVKVNEIDAWREGNGAEVGIIPAKSVTKSEWNFVIGKGADLFNRLREMPVKLGDVADIFVGLQTSADPIFLFKQYRRDRDHHIVFSEALGKEIRLESAILKEVVRSGDIGRYFAQPNALVLFPYKRENDKEILITQRDFENRYPLSWEYLKLNKKALEAREGGKFRGAGWYQLYPKNLNVWEQPKLMAPYMITRLSTYLDVSDNFYFVNVTTGGFGITAASIDLRYLTALLNSLLLDFYLRQVKTNFRGGYFAANKQFISQLPIRTIDFSNPSEKAAHGRIVSLVERMLDLHKKKAAMPPSAEREKVEREITITDERIDDLVYGLYGLTEEEIGIAEGKDGITR